MLTLRPFKTCDAENIVSWFDDETVFRMWGGELIGAYPISSKDVVDMYLGKNGMCSEEDNFYPFTATEDGVPVGHLIIRYLEKDRKFLRLGWVIVDGSKRGKGYGKKLIQLSTKYAFEMLGADKVCLGVFENNPAAYHCYKAAGFGKPSTREDSYTDVDGEKWKVIELEITKEKYYGT